MVYPPVEELEAADNCTRVIVVIRIIQCPNRPFIYIVVVLNGIEFVDVFSPMFRPLNVHMLLSLSNIQPIRCIQKTDNQLVACSGSDLLPSDVKFVCDFEVALIVFTLQIF